MSADDGRRLKRVRVDARLLESVIGVGVAEPFVAKSAIPDLRIMGISLDVSRGEVEMLVWSSSFPVLPTGAEPDRWDPTYVRCEISGRIVVR